LRERDLHRVPKHDLNGGHGTKDESNETQIHNNLINKVFELKICIDLLCLILLNIIRMMIFELVINWSIKL
jgi:hypothetical protein